jgi:hypothetical protein
MKAAVIEEITRTRCLNMLPAVGCAKLGRGFVDCCLSKSVVFGAPSRRLFEGRRNHVPAVLCGQPRAAVALEHDSRLEVQRDLRHVYGDMDVDWQR